MNIHTFEKMAAQGDIAFKALSKKPKDAMKLLPKNAVEVKPCSVKDFVLSHSKAGHTHIVKPTPDVQFYTLPDDQMKAYLVVHKVGPIVEHTRQHDTHEPIQFPVGVIEVRRQRESAPEGWRVALD